eukprot:TRINITY_DN933_c0_g1_i1.p1 TRINITY_DN933_c0_g1~~TRINITY_DN933_c0_g1_i1.p1  ORF type:complete len:136 (-),score=36.91 TRINITY_DN933_c0_g1_i1:169-546(-)
MSSLWPLIFLRAKQFRGKSAARRKPLTTKNLPPGWKKGTGTPNLGQVTSKGKFIMDHSKIPNVVFPTSQNPQLHPFVAGKTERIKNAPKTIQYYKELFAPRLNELNRESPFLPDSMKFDYDPRKL